MNHKDKVQSAMEAIEDVFSDTSVSPDATRESLQELRDEIDMKMETLPRE